MNSPLVTDQLRLTMELIVRGFARCASLPPLAKFYTEAGLEQLEWAGRARLSVLLDSLREEHKTVTWLVASPAVTIITTQDQDETPAHLVDVWTLESTGVDNYGRLTFHSDADNAGEIGPVSLGSRFFNLAKATGVALNVRTAWDHPATATALVLHHDGMSPAGAVKAAIALEM